MPADSPDRLARITTAFVARVARRPRLVLLVAFAITLASVALAYARLEYHVQRNDLLSADKPCQKRWQKYLDAFGDDDDMVVVAEGTDRAAMQAALDDVAAELKKRPELFDRVFHRADLRALADRALLYLPPEEIDSIRDRVERMGPLLGDLGPLAWRKLCVQSLLGNATAALEKRAAGSDLNASERELIAFLPELLRWAAATVRGEKGAAVDLANPAILLHARQLSRTPHMSAEEGGAVVHAREGGQRRDAGRPCRRRNAAP